MTDGRPTSGGPTAAPLVDRRLSVLGEALGTLALAAYSVTAAVSFAALVFAGDVSDGLPRGAATFVFASGVITLFLAWRSRFQVAIASVQDTAAIVLVPAGAAVAAGSSDDPVRDVFVIVAISTVLTGAVLWGVGRARLAGAARFMPTTVVVGFLAGTGWLLAKGGVDVMTAMTVELTDLDDLVRLDLVKLWLPGVVLGAFIAVAPFVRWLSPAASSLVTIAMTIGFFVVVGAASSLDAVEEGGWLVGPFPGGGRIDLIDNELVEADWAAVGGAAGSIGVVVILSFLGALLNISGLQAFQRQRIDLDTELRSTGLANLAVAPIGGLVGYHAIGDTTLAVRLGITRRWVPLAVGVLVLVVAVAGREVIGYLPRFVAGGLLVGAGVGLLVDWAGDLRRTANWWDRIVSVAIVATIAFVGILEGIVVGIVAACVFFVIRYSRIDPVRVVSTGNDRRSVVGRPPAEVERLDELGDHLVAYELHGSLFFGSVTRMADRVRSRLGLADEVEESGYSGASTDAEPVEFVIVDFARVADVDASAYSVLAELAGEVAGSGVGLIWSGLSDAELAALDRVSESSVTHAADIDAAFEYAEDELLARHGGAGDVEVAPVASRYSRALLDTFTGRRVSSGSVLVRENEPSDELFVVTSGRVRVTRRRDDGGVVRLRVLGEGATLGEIGFLTGEARTATVTADGPVEVLVLDRAEHDRLRSDRPDLAMELYDAVLQSTAELAAAIHRSLTQAMR